MGSTAFNTEGVDRTERGCPLKQVGVAGGGCRQEFFLSDDSAETVDSDRYVFIFAGVDQLLSMPWAKSPCVSALHSRPSGPRKAGQKVLVAMSRSGWESMSPSTNRTLSAKPSSYRSKVIRRLLQRPGLLRRLVIGQVVVAVAVDIDG